MKDEFAILRVVILVAASALVLAVVGHAIREAHEQREQMRADQLNLLRKLAATNETRSSAGVVCPAVEPKRGQEPGSAPEGSVAAPGPVSRPASDSR